MAGQPGAVAPQCGCENLGSCLSCHCNRPSALSLFLTLSRTSRGPPTINMACALSRALAPSPARDRYPRRVALLHRPTRRFRRRLPLPARLCGTTALPSLHPNSLSLVLFFALKLHALLQAHIIRPATRLLALLMPRAPTRLLLSVPHHRIALILQLALSPTQYAVNEQLSARVRESDRMRARACEGMRAAVQPARARARLEGMYTRARARVRGARGGRKRIYANESCTHATRRATYTNPAHARTARAPRLSHARSSNNRARSRRAFHHVPKENAAAHSRGINARDVTRALQRNAALHALGRDKLLLTAASPNS